MAKHVLTRLFGIGALLLMASCGLAVSFDDYGTIAPPSDASIGDPEAAPQDGAAPGTTDYLPDAATVDTGPPAPLFGVRGTVSGLDGARVRLGLEGSGAIDVLADGPFAFPRTLPDGTLFVVTVLSPPVGHVCVVDHGFGAVAGADVDGVLVKCRPAGADLATLSLPLCVEWSADMSQCAAFANVAPAFSPSVRDYAISVPAIREAGEWARLTAVAVEPSASIKVIEPANVTGAPSIVPFDPYYGAYLVTWFKPPTTIVVDVTAPDGVTHALYNIVITADGAHYVKAASPRAGSAFGAAVALDVDTLIVGAPGESSSAVGINGAQDDASAPGSGAVYVFKRTFTPTHVTWSQQAYIKASNTRAGARFGSAVVLSGTTLFVASDSEASGASGVDADQSSASAPGAGAVYVFEQVGGAWSQQAYLKASNPSSGAHFGAAISFSGDSLAVGAPGEAGAATGIDGDQSNLSAPDAGAAYVFRRVGASWSQEAYVKASNTRAAAKFGAALALSGDRLAVGSPGETGSSLGLNGSQSDGGLANAGAAYVVKRVGAAWSHEIYVKEPDAAHAGAKFGSSVGLTPYTLAVARLLPSMETVSIFGLSPPAPGWGGGQDVYFSPVRPTPVGYGSAMAFPAYTFGPTHDYYLAVGAPFDGVGGTVYLPGGPRFSHAIEATFNATNPRPGALFGTSLAHSATTLVVGSPGESSAASGVDGDQADTSAPSAGAVYVY